MTAGAGWAADVWAITPANQAYTNASTGLKLEVKIPVTMPPLITPAAGIVASWSLAIKTTRASSGTSLPANYADVEVAKAAPITTGLKITTARS